MPLEAPQHHLLISYVPVLIKTPFSHDTWKDMFSELCVHFVLIVDQAACLGKVHKTLIQTVPSQQLAQSLYENLHGSTSSQLQWKVEAMLHQGLEVWNLLCQRFQLKHHVTTIALLDALASPEE